MDAWEESWYGILDLVFAFHTTHVLITVSSTWQKRPMHRSKIQLESTQKF